MFPALRVQGVKLCLSRGAEIFVVVLSEWLSFLFNKVLTILRRGCTFQKLQSMKTAGFEQPDCQGLLRCPWWIYQTSELEVDNSISAINHRHTLSASLHNSYSPYCILFALRLLPFPFPFHNPATRLKCLHLSDDLFSPYMLPGFDFSSLYIQYCCGNTSFFHIMDYCIVRTESFFIPSSLKIIYRTETPHTSSINIKGTG